MSVVTDGEGVEVRLFSEGVEVERSVLRQVDTISWSIPHLAMYEDREAFFQRVRKGLAHLEHAFMWAYDRQHKEEP